MVSKNLRCRAQETMRGHTDPATMTASTDEPFDLVRFVDAQDAGDTYAHAVAELRGGRETSHWMWFVFPQIEGLGQSAMAKRYAIGSLDEARAYLAHPCSERASASASGS